MAVYIREGKRGPATDNTVQRRVSYSRGDDGKERTRCNVMDGVGSGRPGQGQEGPAQGRGGCVGGAPRSLRCRASVRLCLAIWASAETGPVYTRAEAMTRLDVGTWLVVVVNAGPSAVLQPVATPDSHQWHSWPLCMLHSRRESGQVEALVGGTRCCCRRRRRLPT